MVRLWSSSPSDYPSPDQSPPEFVDLDSYIPDFDPVKEWLVDPDHAPLMAAEEAEVRSPDGRGPKMDGSAVPGELSGTSINEKMEKVCLGEFSGNPDIRDGEQRDGLDAGIEAAGSKENGDEVPKNGIFVDPSVGGGGSEVRDGPGGFMAAVKVDGESDVCSVSDSIKMAGKSEEESSETESDESEDDSSSTDGSSSSSSEDDDIHDDNDGRNKVGEADEMADVEEGEIRDLDEEEVVICSDEDDVAIKGPIKSKHEIEVLPPVPQFEVFFEPHHRTVPVGVISSILGIKVIVEGSEKHSPVSEGSILWITETRSPLGLVDEIFGPVKSPYYVVRYNSEKELPVGINVGTSVSVVMEFATHILNDKDLYKKGYDASGDHDEEASDEVEFSDDEKEAEYKKSMRQSKRVVGNRRDGNPEFAVDKRRANFKGPAANDSWHRNQESAIDKRTNFKGAPANPRWHGNKKSPIDKKITNFKGAPIQKHMQPPILGAPPAMGQPLPSVTGSLQASPVTANFGCGSFTSPIGAGNAFVNCFADPSQQFLLQQVNALSHGFQLQQQQMGVQGQYPMNILPCHQHQNQVFSSFPNAMLYQQQLIPNFGGPANMPWFGGPLNPSFGPTSLGPMGQSSVSQAPFGCSNVHEQGTSGSCNTPVYGQPPPSTVQGGMFSMQFNPSIGPTPLGPMGQSSISQAPSGCYNVHEQGTSGSCNAPVYGGPLQSTVQGGMSSMQFNPSIGPTSFSAPMGQLSQAPFGCSNVHGQVSSGSHNPSSYGQPLPAVAQGGQFNASIGPTSLMGPMGQSGVGQASFGFSNMHEQGDSGSHNAPSHGQPPSATFQGGMRPPMQFNQERSPFRGRKHYQRGGRHSFGRGGRPQNG